MAIPKGCIPVPCDLVPYSAMLPLGLLPMPPVQEGSKKYIWSARIYMFPLRSDVFGLTCEPLLVFFSGKTSFPAGWIGSSSLALQHDLASGTPGPPSLCGLTTKTACPPSWLSWSPSCLPTDFAVSMRAILFSADSGIHTCFRELSAAPKYPNAFHSSQLATEWPQKPK